MSQHFMGLMDSLVKSVLKIKSKSFNNIILDKSLNFEVLT